MGLRPTIPKAPRHLVVLHDCSISRSRCEHERGFALMRQVAAVSQEVHGTPIGVTVVCFDMAVRSICQHSTVKQAVQALQAVKYMGATNLASAIEALGQESLQGLYQGANAPSEVCTMLFSDGEDSLGATAYGPAIEGIARCDNPVRLHVVMVEGASAGLRAVAHRTGGVYTELQTGAAVPDAMVRDSALVEAVGEILGASTQGRVIQRVEVEGLEEEESLFLDDAVSFVPDAKLCTTSWPITDAGTRVTASLPSPTLGTVAVSVSEGCRQGKVLFNAGEARTSVPAGSRFAHLLGLLHCDQLLQLEKAISLDPEHGRTEGERVGRRYGVASEHTSLLVLEDARSFLDNDVPCPTTHPAHQTWKELTEKEHSHEDNEDFRVKTKLGTKVQRLHQRFSTYLASPVPVTEMKVWQSQSRGGGLFGAAPPPQAQGGGLFGGGVTDAERLAKITADIAGNYERWPNSAGSRLWLT